MSPHATSTCGRSASRAAALACCLLLLSLAVALLGAASSRADVFGPISLVSAGLLPGSSAVQQAEYAHDAAISGNGQFAAFDGSVGGVSGVWRRELATGALEQVAGGDAELPSISESGRYVSFTTNEGSHLVELTDRRAHPAVPEAANVYVRDLSKAPTEASAFEVASAPSGSAEALTYAGAGTSTGSTAAGRSAISADGNEVAFVTTAVSDLLSATPSEPTTPAFQVAVRFLDSDQTMLVSGEYEPAVGQTSQSSPVSVQEGGVSFGAVYPGHAPSFRPPPANGRWGKSPPPGASISADGSTVAWMGEDIGQQARMLPGESPPPLYTEPLWRRITPGAQTPTERVTGGSDPGNPACAASGEATLPSPASAADPCQGPFNAIATRGNQSSGIWTEGGTSGGEGDFVPRLSADGYTVAFIASALPVSLGSGFANAEGGEAPDLYLADMHPGLTRAEALTTLTELASATTIAGADPITDFDISPNGQQVAFTTRRTVFPLGSPAFVSNPAAEPGLSELFDVDLSDDTLTRVTEGYEGGPAEQPHATKQNGGAEDIYGEDEPFVGAQSPSLSADGALLSFDSTASNLVFGDGNTPPSGPLDGSDAFLVQREIFLPQPTPLYISPAPQVGGTLAWRLGVSAVSRRDGSVLLYLALPGAGTLSVTARSAVLERSVAKRRARSGRSSAAGKRTTQRVVMRSVSTARRHVSAATLEPTTLVLKLAKPYATLASRRGGLSAALTLAFTATGHAALHQSIRVTFARTIRAKRSAKKKKKASR
jgi:Tol biopolymer transport system component